MRVLWLEWGRLPYQTVSVSMRLVLSEVLQVLPLHMRANMNRGEGI